MVKTAKKKIIIIADHAEAIVQIVGNHDVIVFQNATGKEWGRLKINIRIAPRGEQVIRQVIFHSPNSHVAITEHDADAVWMSVSSND